MAERASGVAWRGPGGSFKGFFADHASLQGLGEDNGEDDYALDEDEDKDEDDNA